MKKMLVLMMAMVMLSGCVGSALTDEPTRAAFIAPSLANPFLASSWSQFQQHMGEYGFDMTFFEGGSEVQKELANVRQCIAEGYEVIFVNPSDHDAIIPSLIEAKEAGLIVGVFASIDLSEDARQYHDFYVGYDDVIAGEAAAAAFVAQFPEGANVIEISGQDGHDAMIKRRDGFRNGIQGTDIVVLDSQNCNGWVTADAMAITEDFIVKYGDEIEGVFCHWDNGATGVLEALHNAGMTDVYVVGVDGNRVGYKQVREGTQAVSIGQSFTEMAKKSMEYARALLDGEPVERINFIPHDIVTLENVDILTEPEW